MGFRHLGGVVGATLLFACARQAAAPAASARLPGEKPETPLEAIYADGGAISQRTLRAAVTITNLRGRTTDEVGPYFEPAQEAVEACAKGTGGKVNVRVRKETTRTEFEIEPGSSLDPRERHCLLEALSLSNLDETSDVNAGATVRTTGFTSLITIAW